MPDKKISALGAIPIVADADLFAAVDLTDTVTKKATASQVQDHVINLVTKKITSGVGTDTTHTFLEYNNASTTNPIVQWNSTIGGVTNSHGLHLLAQESTKGVAFHVESYTAAAYKILSTRNVNYTLQDYIGYLSTGHLQSGTRKYWSKQFDAPSANLKFQTINDAVITDRLIFNFSTGLLSVGTTSYETLVLSDNDIPNRKFVLDAIATVDSWNEVMHLGNTFTIANTENLSATITQNDVTNNPAALILVNTGSGNDITLPNASYIKNGELVLRGDITGATLTAKLDADGWIKTTALATTINVDVGAHVTDMIVNYSSNDVNYAIWGTGVVQPLIYTDAGNNIIGLGTANPDANFMVTVDGNLKTTGAVGSSASRVSKGWYTDFDSGKITVDNLVLNGNTLSSTSGAINITPDNPADHIIINGHWDFDGKTLVAISDSDTTLTAYAGKNITIEGVTFDGGVVAAITSLTVDNINLNGNTVSGTGTEILYLKSGTNRPVVIGDGLVTAFYYANCVVDGVVSDDLNGPHIATIVSTDLTHPLFYVSSFAHDDVSINFDAYKVSGNYISADVGSNYQIHKNGDGLLFRYASSVSVGGTITWATGFRMGTSGLVNFFGSVQADIINEHTGGAGVTIDSVLLKDGYVNQEGIFAEIFVADASTAQSIATGVTYTKSTAWTSNGQSSNATSDSANDKITITQLGKYRVSGSCSATSGKANLTWRGAAFLNGVEQNQVHWKRKMTTTTDSGDMEFTGFIDVTTVPWDLDFRLRHDDGANQNFTIEYANLNVEYMGST